MKIRKKFVIYLSGVLIFVIFLFTANYIFYHVIRADREARPATISLPAETHNIKFNIEEVRKERLGWKDAVLIRGWVFRQAVKEKKRAVYLVLASKNKMLIFNADNASISRPDVSAGFHLEDSINNHGFEICVPLFRLKEDSYKIGFAIRDETGNYFSGYDKVLRISHDSVFIRNAVTGFVSKQVETEFLKPVKETLYHFEKIERTAGFLNVYGWGFLKGMDAVSLRTFFLLRHNGRVQAYSVHVQTRKDVTGFFSREGLNLDASGFQATIPLDDLEKGDYRLGLYIEKEGQAGSVFPKKFISIRK
jgi:hypothetical protein